MELVVLSVTGKRHTLTLGAEQLSLEGVRQAAAAALGAPAQRLKLVHGGHPLTDAAAVGRLRDGDSILAVVAPRPPPLEVQQLAEGAGDEDDDAELLRFTLPPDAPRWQRQLAALLQQRLGCGDWMLTALWGLGPRFWLGLVAWPVGARAAAAYGVGGPFIVLSLIALMLLNLGRRREGEASAYSVFNEGFQQLPGQITAEHLDGQLRRGHL